MPPKKIMLNRITMTTQLDDSLDEVEVLRDESLAVVHDEHAVHVELDGVLALLCNGFPATAAIFAAFCRRRRGKMPHAEPEKPKLEEVKSQPQAMPEQPKPDADKKSQETLPQAEPQKSLELTTLNAEKSVVPHSQVPTEFKSLGANTAQSPTAGAIMSPSLSVASVPPTSLISPTISVGSSAVDPSMISLTRYPSSASVVSSANTNTGFSIPDLQTSISTTSIDSKVFTEATQQTSMADSLAGTATPTASAVEQKPEADKKAPEIQSQPGTQKPEEPPKQP
ncbi:hypothetical protein L596_012259 [Steinernema carpocapsae]|uniref:Uncharacterized protein n=1 Tax=Steinernema carpocapsae TaxID=34508 RepID=A0A4U5NXC6_STECR|nr:hypothetical protein L596_012259 [Steinernema carpocapsae]